MEKIRFNKIPIRIKFCIYQLNYGLLNAWAILLVVLKSPFLLMLSLISRFANICVEFGHEDALPDYLLVELLDVSTLEASIEYPRKPPTLFHCKGFGLSNRAWAKKEDKVWYEGMVQKQQQTKPKSQNFGISYRLSTY